MYKVHEVPEMLKRLQVIVQDHVVYTKDNRHGDTYIAKDRIYPYTADLSRLARLIAGPFEAEKVDIVIGPVVGGAILANRVAEHLSMWYGRNVFAVYADKEADRFVVKREYGKFLKIGRAHV